MALVEESGFNQPQIALEDENGNKIKLKLRRMSFERETVDHLPADLLEILKIMTAKRAGRNDDLYMIVACWCKLRRYEGYWTSFHFESEYEFLDYYDFPEQKTLEQLLVIIYLFDKDTFMLLGEKILSHMLLQVSKHQPELDEKKKDYQGIFDQYCKHHDAFDKNSFYRVMREYIQKKYLKPEEEKADGKARKEWIHRDGKKDKKGKRDPFSPGERKRRFARKSSGSQQYDPHLHSDLDWRTESCPVCKEKIALMEELLLQLEICEELIRNRLGEKEVPKRPSSIRDLHP